MENWFLEGSEIHEDLEGEKVTYTFQYQGHSCALSVAHDDHIVKIELPRNWRITTYEKLNELISAFEGETFAPPIHWDSAPAWANFCTVDRNGARFWWDTSPEPSRASGKWEHEEATTYPVTLLHHWRGFIEARPDPDQEEVEDHADANADMFDDFVLAGQQQHDALALTEQQIIERQRERQRRLREQRILQPDLNEAIYVNAGRHLYLDPLDRPLRLDPLNEPDMEAEALARAAADGHPVAVAVQRHQQRLANAIANLGERVDQAADRVNELEDVIRAEPLERTTERELGNENNLAAEANAYEIVHGVRAAGGELRHLHFVDLPHHSVMVYTHDNGAITPFVYYLWTPQGPVETHDDGVINAILERLFVTGTERGEIPPTMEMPPL